jgi:hypothetical protein
MRNLIRQQSSPPSPLSLSENGKGRTVNGKNRSPLTVDRSPLAVLPPPPQFSKYQLVTLFYLRKALWDNKHTGVTLVQYMHGLTSLPHTLYYSTTTCRKTFCTCTENARTRTETFCTCTENARTCTENFCNLLITK